MSPEVLVHISPHSCFPKSQPAPLRRRTRRGPRKPCYIAEELEDDMEADAKLACILNRRVSTSPSATSDVPYYTEHSATPEEEEPPRWPSTTSQILTFQDFRRQLQIHVRSSANIPHLFQDHINSLPQSFRDRPEIRAVFEAMMIENTWRDEPGAPRIKIINNIDSETSECFCTFKLPLHCGYSPMRSQRLLGSFITQIICGMGVISQLRMRKSSKVVTALVAAIPSRTHVHVQSDSEFYTIYTRIQNSVALRMTRAANWCLETINIQSWSATTCVPVMKTA